MALYFKDIEITNIDNLVPQTSLDITDLWFGSTNIYTVWQVYEGTLPATINANGSDLRQYQVWGNVGGVGDRTVNHFDVRTVSQNTFLGENDATGPSAVSDTSDYIYVKNFSHGLLKSFKTGQPFNTTTRFFCFYDSQKNFLGRDLSLTYKPGDIVNGVTISIPNNAEYVRFSYDKRYSGPIMFILSNSAIIPPETFVPFGYEVDIGVKSANVMPSAPAETKTLNGVTITCDGKGRYSISGEADQNTDIIFDIPSFTVPVSIYNGGDGFLMLHNTVFSNVNLDFLYNGTIKEAWSLATANRTSTDFSRLSGIPINTIRFHVTPGTVNGIVCPMLTDNGESTPVKYQPYSNTTTSVYIGDEPLEKVRDYADYVDYQKQKVVKEIKKYVFDGTENWEQILGAGGDSTKNYFRLNLSSATYLNASFSRCSHFTWTLINTSTTVVGFRTYIPTGSNVVAFVVRPENVANMGSSDFKSWLAEQYAAGTPVTAWCALQTPEEEDPPVPLPALPTCEGTTVIDYEGQSVAPEKAILKYRKEGF